MKKLTIVTSVYNGGKSFLEFTNGILELNHLLLKKWRIELIVVDDASTDNSWEIIKDEMTKLGADGISCKAFKQLSNRGQHNSLFDGMAQILDRDTYLVLIDGDGEEEPREIYKLIQTIENEEIDSVIAIQDRNDKSLIRGILGRIGWNLIKFFQIDSVQTNECTLRILNPLGAKLLISSKALNPILGREQAKLGLKTKTILISKNYKGFTSYSFGKRWKLFIRNLTYSNSIYIRLSQLTLFTGIVFGISTGLFFTYYYIISPNPVEGYTSIGLLISSMFSLNFIVLSFITKLNSKPNDLIFIKDITYREKFELNND